MIYVEGSEYVEKNGVVEKNNNYNIKSNLNNNFDMSIHSNGMHAVYNDISSDKLLELMSKPRTISKNDIDFPHIAFLMPKNKTSLKKKDKKRQSKKGTRKGKSKY
jgi:hypothetical protein